MLDLWCTFVEQEIKFVLFGLISQHVFRSGRNNTPTVQQLSLMSIQSMHPTLARTNDGLKPRIRGPKAKCMCCHRFVRGVGFRSVSLLALRFGRVQRSFRSDLDSKEQAAECFVRNLKGSFPAFSRLFLVIPATMSGFGERLSQRQKAPKECFLHSIQEFWCQAFKKGVDADDARRKREDAAVQLRKQTRDEVEFSSSNPCSNNVLR